MNPVKSPIFADEICIFPRLPWSDPRSQSTPCQDQSCCLRGRSNVWPRPVERASHPRRCEGRSWNGREAMEFIRLYYDNIRMYITVINCIYIYIFSFIHIHVCILYIHTCIYYCLLFLLFLISSTFCIITVTIICCNIFMEMMGYMEWRWIKGCKITRNALKLSMKRFYSIGIYVAYTAKCTVAISDTVEH